MMALINSRAPFGAVYQREKLWSAIKISAHKMHSVAESLPQHIPHSLTHKMCKYGYCKSKFSNHEFSNATMNVRKWWIAHAMHVIRN